jgi:hypothetical protein
MEGLQQKIQQRAYNLFLERGGQPGHEMEDWANAEKEIIAQKAAPETKALFGQPVESLVFENKKQPQPVKKQEIYPAKKVERKLQAVNSRN